MTLELKNFFRKIKNSNPYNYFLLRKLYYNPKFVLNKTKEDMENEIYYDESLENYLNDDFFEFLIIVLDDETFLNKLDYYMAENLRKYFEDLHELKYDRNDENNIITRNIDLLKEIEYKIIKFSVEQYMIDKITNDMLKCSIEDDNYPLRKYPYYSDKIVVSLYCQNKFLDIIENQLLCEDLDINIIDKIINILLISIKIKTMNYSNMFEVNARYKISNNSLKEFDLKKSEELIEKLEEKRSHINKKIIYYRSC